MIVYRSSLFFLLVAHLFCAFSSVSAQTEKYDVRQIKIYVSDKNGSPWNDTSAFMGVRLDPAKKDTLEDQEIGSGTITYSVGEEYRRYSLKSDQSGSIVSDVPFVVYKDSDRAINYELTLLRKEGEKYIEVPLTNRSLSVSRAAGNQLRVTASVFKPMLLNDWFLYGGIMLASMIFIYFVIIRWLFSVLLFNNNWPVSRAEYFTTSLGLLLLMAVFGLLLVVALPQTVVMWTILGLLSVFWVGHAVVWALS
jgi:hypothetical protein